MEAVLKLLEEQPLFVGFGVLIVILALVGLVGGSSSSPSKQDDVGAKAKDLPPTANGSSSSSKKKNKNKNKKKAKKAAESSAENHVVEKAAPEPEKAPEKKSKKKVSIVEEKPKSLPKSLPEPPVVEEPVKEELSASAKKNKKKKNKKKIKAAAAAAAETSSKASRDVLQPEAVKQEDSDDDDDDDFTRILSKKALEKTVGKTGAAKINAKQRKEEEKIQQQQQEEWVTVNKTNSASVQAPTPDPAVPKDDVVRSETLPLGPDDPALIIGPKGATIQAIQLQSGAKLDVNKASVGASNSIKITGTDSAIASAKEQVLTLVETAAEEKRRATAFSVTLSKADIKGSDGVKSIIGKGGATIKSIQAKTETTIDANVDAGTVVITGPIEEQVAQAATLCKHAVFGESQHTIELGSRSMVMVIYGKDFNKIREMQTESGAKLDIDRSSTTLKLSGSTEAVRKARAMVEEWMEFCKGQTVEIEASKVGAVYGKQGQTIRRIQERTGAFVDVNDNGKKGKEMVSCRILGTPEAVKEALVLFQKAIDGEIELKPGEVMESMELGVGAPAVIGRGGSKIRELEQAHSVKLRINAESICNIVGKPEAVAAAKAVIEKVIAPLLEEQKAKLEVDRLAAQGDPNWGGAWVDDGSPYAAEGW